jgi:hypothetical protein
VIMDYEATTAIRQAEVGAGEAMLARTAEQFDVTPLRLVADGATVRPRWSCGRWTTVSTRPSAQMKRSLGATSPSIEKTAFFMSAPPAKN